MAKDTPLNAYRSTSVDAAVLTASPHQLIVLLYQGARAAIAKARTAMQRSDLPARGQAISNAIAIIDDGLNASLDRNKGEAVAERLNALYDYMVSQLALANAQGDAAKLDEVGRLLADLEGAWRQIGSNSVKSVVPEDVAGATPRSSSISYGKA